MKNRFSKHTNCGFIDVRKRGDGEYYCYKCGQQLGADYRLRLEKSLPPKYLQQLDKQCEETING